MNSLRAFFRYLTAPFRIVLRWPVNVIGTPRRLMGLALPLRVAVLMAIFLVLLTVTAYVGFFLSNDRTHWYEWTRPSRLVMLGLLVAVTPVVLYYALRLWLEGDTSRFPDIDRAWQEGIATLAENGLELRDLPLFLILGATDDRLCDRLMRSTGYELIVDGEPRGVRPLRFYADRRAIFLCCPETGCLGKFNALATAGTRHQAEAGVSIVSTLVAGQPSGQITGTAAANGPYPSIRGTMVPNIASTLSADEPQPAAAANPLVGGRGLSRAQVDEESARLGYIAELIGRLRQPFCPLNGILTLLPFGLIEDASLAKELPSCVRHDLNTIRQTTRLMCPVTALVAGMESEPGFAELMRRVGLQRASDGRFGKGFKIWSFPTQENLDALTSHACGAFEDWIYALFREEGGLNKPGNGKLFALLCKMRSRLKNRLRAILWGGFGCEGEHDAEATLLSGCYFAATGEVPERQAFVRGALEKLVQQEEELQWTEQALTVDRRYRRGAQFCMLVNGCLIVALIVLVAYRFWEK